MGFDETSAEELADRLVAEVERGSCPPRTPVPSDGAARAAAMIAEVL